MKKKIALDLDGVVFDSENLYRVYTEIYDVDNLNGDNLVDNTKRIFQKRYNWQQEEFQKFYTEYSDEILSKANLMPGADIVIPKLLKDFDIIIVTSRGDDEIKYATDKFDKINLEGVTIYNNEHHKIDRLISEDVDYVIDDDIDICKNASLKGIKALYFKNNASEEVNNINNLKTVHNWGEIYKFIMLNR